MFDTDMYTIQVHNVLYFIQLSLKNNFFFFDFRSKQPLNILNAKTN